MDIFLQLLMLICVAVFIIVVMNIQKNKQLQRENDYINLQSNLLKDHHAALEHQIETTRRFRHDVANYITTMDELMKSNSTDELVRYKAELEDIYQSLKKVDYCNNIVVDSVIHNKKKECDQKGIALDLQVNHLECDGIEEADLLAVIYTLFDLAIQNASRTSGMVIFKCQNLASNLVMQMTYPIHAPKDKMSKEKQTLLKELARKYDGEFEEEKHSNADCITVTLKQR